MATTEAEKEYYLAAHRLLDEWIIEESEETHGE